jgi:hypothetical protein
LACLAAHNLKFRPTSAARQASLGPMPHDQRRNVDGDTSLGRKVGYGAHLPFTGRVPEIRQCRKPAPKTQIDGQAGSFGPLSHVHELATERPQPLAVPRTK